MPSGPAFAFAPLPAQGRQHRSNPSGVANAEPIDGRSSCRLLAARRHEIRPLYFEAERAACDVDDGDLRHAVQPIADWFFPRVAFVAFPLLGDDVIALEILVGPPVDAIAIELHGFGK